MSLPGFLSMDFSEIADNRHCYTKSRNVSTDTVLTQLLLRGIRTEKESATKDRPRRSVLIVLTRPPVETLMRFDSIQCLQVATTTETKSFSPLLQ